MPAPQEASAEAKYLLGLGMANERKAIVQGLKASVELFAREVHGASASDAMDLILLAQYFGKGGGPQGGRGGEGGHATQAGGMGKEYGPKQQPVER
jgi:hypothetical protein